MDVCTVIAKNYVAHARVLGRSFAAQHPEGRFYVLIVDEYEGYLDPEEEPFTIVTPAEIGIDDFVSMAAIYDVLELCTAVKPWLLRWMLARSPDGTAVYLDPDMRVYAPLHELFACVREHRLVLSPHNVEPMPRDGKRPNEQDILSCGTYNLGLLGLGSGEFAQQLLPWWTERLKTDCIIDLERGFFVDQRWIDLVPGMAPSFHVLRDPGLNVAYWNLVSRPIGRDADGAWMAGDMPLRLFHFSGFDPEHPHALSKYQDRISLEEHRDLAQLCLQYAREVRAEGADESREWPYTYAATASGLTLTTNIRRACRELLADGGLEGSIFEPAGEAALIEKLNAPAEPRFGGASGVTRYLASLHDRHARLRRSFPDLVGVDGPRYLDWVRSDGHVEVPAPLLPVAAKTQLPRQPTAAALGVNVAGYLNPGLAVGEVARAAIDALDAGGVPVLPVAIAAPAGRQGRPLMPHGSSRGGYPINLVCVEAEALPAFARDMGPEFFSGRHSIGWWSCGMSQLPEQWLDTLCHVDELWAASQFVADALAAGSTVPVTRVPFPVTVPGAPRSEPQRLGLPHGFSFLCSYDPGMLARQNPLGAIEAFLRAFPEPGEAILVLASNAAEQPADDRAAVSRATAGHRHIVSFDARLEAVDRAGLVASCDCYVSLHRSEGFGMTMAEAMFLGKPVIATGYSGNRDFMTPENSWLVNYELTAVAPGAEAYPAEYRWADPDLKQAAVRMREVFGDRQSAISRARRGAEDIRRTHSPTAIGTQMAALLGDISTRLPEAHGRWEGPPALAHTRTAAELLRIGARPAPASGAGRAQRLLRQLVLRVMKPHTAYQHQVDRALTDALERVSVDIRELAERGLAVEASGLQGLRDLERRMRALLEPDPGLDEVSADRIDDLAPEVFEAEPQERTPTPTSVVEPPQAVEVRKLDLS